MRALPCLAAAVYAGRSDVSVGRGDGRRGASLQVRGARRTGAWVVDPFRGVPAAAGGRARADTALPRALAPAGVRPGGFAHARSSAAVANTDAGAASSRASHAAAGGK